MKRVIIESPYAGDIDLNVAYANACLLDSLRRGEAPFASHLLYPQVLDDATTHERAQGIAAGFAWGDVADLTAVYEDFGISTGMQLGIDRAVSQHRAIEYRTLYGKKGEN